MNDDIFNQVPQEPIQHHLGDVPSLDEVKKAINQLKNNKATGSDGVPAEILKVSGPALTDYTIGLLQKYGALKRFPQIYMTSPSSLYSKRETKLNVKTIEQYHCFQQLERSLPGLFQIDSFP